MAVRWPTIAHALLLLLVSCAAPGEDRSRLFTEDGVEQFSKGQYRNALESFDMALTFRPQDPALLFNMAECYDRLGDSAKAEQYYTYCLERNPNAADARLALVALQYRAGRGAVAKDNIGAWLQEHPQSADAYVLDAWRLRQEKDLPHAQGRLQQALDLEPHNRRALTELGYLYETMGMPDRSLVLYERVLKRDPTRTEVATRLDELRSKGVKRPQLD